MNAGLMQGRIIVGVFAWFEKPMEEQCCIASDKKKNHGTASQETRPATSPATFFKFKRRFSVNTFH